MATRSLNKVILIGNLTRDPELRYTPQGTAVCQFGLATNRDWVTANGEKKEDVQYHRIVAWSKLAELCSQLLAKGSKIYAEGRIVYRNFEGKDGVQKSVTEIVLDNMILLRGTKASGAVSEGEEESTSEQDLDQADAEISEKEMAEEAKEDKEEQEVEENSVGNEEEVSEDEIPF